jgi:hypothetical protein
MIEALRQPPARTDDVDTLQHNTLIDDVQQVLGLRRAINAATRLDPQRVLAAVAAAAGAEIFLPYTIPSLIQQIARAGRGADVVIGLNNGFTCAPLVERLQELPGVEVVLLYTADKPQEDVPAPIFDNPGLSGAQYTVPTATRWDRPHRIFVVHQKAGRHAAGKIRMLHDIVHGLVLGSVRRGWSLPVYTLLFDAESLFMAQDDADLVAELQEIRQLYAQHQGDVGQVITALIDTCMKSQRGAARPQPLDPLSKAERGLDLMIAELDRDPDLDLVGSAVMFCAFDRVQDDRGLKVVLPNFGTPISPMHLLSNYVHGLLREFSCLPGGGTLGRSDAILSLIGFVSQSYPGARSEDALYTVLAEHAGFPKRIARHVGSTNCCPSLTERLPDQPDVPAWQLQQMRWYGGIDAIEQQYGTENVRSILAKCQPNRFLFLALAIVARRLHETGDIAHCMGLLQQFQGSKEAYDEVRRMAALQPNILSGSRANPAWRSPVGEP